MIENGNKKKNNTNAKTASSRNVPNMHGMNHPFSYWKL